MLAQHFIRNALFYIVRLPCKRKDVSRFPVWDVQGWRILVGKAFQGLDQAAGKINSEGTSKNYPIAVWADLLPLQCVLKTPQNTKYSGIFKIIDRTKSLAQTIKKTVFEVA